MPREPLDAPDDLPKQALCQVALGQLEDEVPRMPDEAPAGRCPRFKNGDIEPDVPHRV
jgi:hypothetical protein